jgi:hypothetical protein
MMEYIESWHTQLRSWLLLTFQDCIQLPILQPDMLKAGMTYCMYMKEKEKERRKYEDKIRG